MSICSHCGYSNPDSNKWCESCGCELITDATLNIEDIDCTPREEVETTFGFIGSMGKTRYVSEHTSTEAEDMQKHVSGFGLMGCMGNVVYQAQVKDEPLSESGDVQGSLLGSVGKTKYSLSKPIDVKDSAHRESKLYGSVGAVEYRTATSPREINTTSGLIGSIGDSIYKADSIEDSGTSKEREIGTAGFVGNMGGIHYIATSKDTPKTDKPPETVKSRNNITITGIAFSLVLIVVLTIVFFKPMNPDFSAAINRRIENEIVFIPDPPAEYEYGNSILRAISYKIVSQNKRANTAIVQFKYVDVMAMADTLGNGAIDQNEYYYYCIEAIKSGTAPYATKTITVAFEMREINGVNQLCVIDSFDFADILSGGTVKAYLRIMEGLS